MNPDELLAQLQQMAQQLVDAGIDPMQIQDAVAQVASGDDGSGGVGDANAPGGMPPEPGSEPGMGDFSDPQGQGSDFAGGGVQGGPSPEEALMAAMNENGSGGSADEMPMMSGNSPMPDISGMAPQGGVPAGSSLADASAMAQEDMKKRMKR